jgi:deoxyribodipyrimidine photolyase-related protein
MRSAFRRALSERTRGATTRQHWIYAPYDQLTDSIGPLSRLPPEEVGLVLIESPAKAARRPYHKQKLALILANMRHFALEQAARGVLVRHVIAPEGYAPALETIAREVGPLTLMRPAERELRHELRPLVTAKLLTPVPHEGWLTTTDDFRASQKGPPWRMDAFYRQVRRRTGLLMEDGKPVGGQFSFDPENREPWRGTPPAPTPPRFTPDEVTREVGELVSKAFSNHPGELDLTTMPATRDDAEALWRWAKQQCLPTFGPYEDAMSVRSTGLFHTRISPLVNLHRLIPQRVVSESAELPIDLASKEGFIRQILGWREFVRHVHEATDGFRSIGPPDENGNAAPSALGSNRPLPQAFWGAPSGLACLDHVVRDVWREGNSHHITRLMVLSNIATLLDVSPRELTDWFWAAYTDAFDWVVEPNVLGMGTYGAGDVMTTKPYVSGAAYIARMSDYCGTCAFHPKTTCPITPLYWAFLARHEAALAPTRRLLMPLASLNKRSEAQRQSDARTFERVSEVLGRGEKLIP